MTRMGAEVPDELGEGSVDNMLSFAEMLTWIPAHPPWSFGKGALKCPTETQMNFLL